MPLSVWYIWCAPFIQMDHEGIISSIEKSMWCASSTQSALEATNYGREEKYPKLCMQQQYMDPIGEYEGTEHKNSNRRMVWVWVSVCYCSFVISYWTNDSVINREQIAALLLSFRSLSDFISFVFQNIKNKYKRFRWKEKANNIHFTYSESQKDNKTRISLMYTTIIRYHCSLGFFFV